MFLLSVLYICLLTSALFRPNLLSSFWMSQLLVLLKNHTNKTKDQSPSELTPL